MERRSFVDLTKQAAVPDGYVSLITQRLLIDIGWVGWLF